MSRLWKHTILALSVLIGLASCTKDKYVNAVPKKVMAVAALDFAQLAECMDMDVPAFMHQCFGWSETKDNGLDLERPVYLFETQDGNFGFCVKMDDADDFETFVAEELSGKLQKSTKPVEWRKCRFSFYDNKWLMGWNDDALLMMGPIVAGQQREMQQQIANMLKLDEKQSVKKSALYDNLQKGDDNALGHISMQAFALPDKVAALFTMGLTRHDNPKQVHITIDMMPEKNNLLLVGNISSTNEKLSEKLITSQKLLRPIDISKVDDMNDSAIVDIFLNINGKEYLSCLRNNPALESVMTIANAAIDLDNVIRSIDGTCHIQTVTVADGRTELLLTAPLAHTQWLKDVPYWKQSTPQGTTLDEQTTPEQKAKGQQHFLIRSRTTDDSGAKTQNLHFGIYATNRFYIGTNTPQTLCQKTAKPDKKHSPSFEYIQHAKTAVVLNLMNLLKDDGIAAAAVLPQLIKPLTKTFHTITYICK